MKIETLFPYAAGSPPAVVLGINLYYAIVTAAGSDFGWLALPVAFLGVGGMIATEVYTYQMAAEALALKAWGAFVLALLGAAVCTGFVMFGVYSGVNTRALISNTAIAIAAYLALAIKRYLDTFQAQKAETHHQAVDVLTAQRLLNNSETRKIKASDSKQTVQQTVQPSSVSTVHRGQFQTDPALVQKIQTCWKDHPDWTQNHIAKECQCSSTTAGKYKPKE